MVQSERVEMHLFGTPLPKPDCPACGEGYIVVRISKKYKFAFEGCSRFPECGWKKLPQYEPSFEPNIDTDHDYEMAGIYGFSGVSAGYNT